PNIDPGVSQGTFDYSKLYGGSGLILDNGDAELWERICNFDNPAPVRALADGVGKWADGTKQLRITKFESFFDRAGYPAGEPVGNHLGQVSDAITDDNRFPWCVILPADEDEAAVAKATTIGGRPIPICPSKLLVESNR